jgi:hypothetical protein
MSDIIQSPNMGLIIPVTSVDSGPDFANNVNASLLTIDGHNHASGNGVQINPGGININSDLPFNANNATKLRSTRYLAQGSPLTASTDYLSLSVSGVDLYYLDGNGNAVRITQSGGVSGSPGSIANLTSPASATYISATPAFVFQSAANTPASIDAGSYVFRDITANSNGITVSAPSGLAANYNLTWPTALPSAQSFVTLDASGFFAAPIAYIGGITGSNISAALALTGSLSVATNLFVGTTSGAEFSWGTQGLGIDAQGKDLFLNASLEFTNGNAPITITPFTSGSTGVLYFELNNSAPRFPMALAGIDLGYTTRTLYGLVQSNGSIIAGQGFTVTNPSNGNYTVNFTDSYYSTPPAITVTPYATSGSDYTAYVTQYGTTTFSIQIIQVVTAAPVQSQFAFSATGRVF